MVVYIPIFLNNGMTGFSFQRNKYILPHSLYKRIPDILLVADLAGKYAAIIESVKEKMQTIATSK